MKYATTATLILAAAAGLGIAAPAAAERADSTAAVQAAATQGQKPAANAKVKYCVMMDPGTGSRISRRACKSKRDWEAVGVDTSSFK